MRIIKGLLMVVLALLVLLIGGGYLLSSQFTVTRSATINASADKVFALVDNPRRWKDWTVWNQRDPAMAMEYSGPERGAGAGWSWKSKSQGDGKMTFTAVEPGKRVDYELFFPDFGTTSKGYLSVASEGSATRVTWVMNGDMGSNPLFRWFALFADKSVGEDFQAGLDGLKALAEKP